jgi:hypothetical protein
MKFGIENKKTTYKISEDDLSELKSIKDAKKFQTNPFISELLIVTTSVYKKDHTFEEKGDNYLVAKEIGKRDKSKFIRLFEFTDINIAKMKGNTAKILLYITYYKMNYDVSVFYLPVLEITNSIGISNITSINEAIIELIKLKYIAKHEENNWYWINPNRLYKGDRKRIET